jgi:hypothetical protein
MQLYCERANSKGREYNPASKQGGRGNTPLTTRKGRGTGARKNSRRVGGGRRGESPLPAQVPGRVNEKIIRKSRSPRPGRGQVGARRHSACCPRPMYFITGKPKRINPQADSTRA